MHIYLIQRKRNIINKYHFYQKKV